MVSIKKCIDAELGILLIATLDFVLSGYFGFEAVNVGFCCERVCNENIYNTYLEKIEVPTA